MYAVVETSGRQYQVKEGKYIDIDLLEANLESKVTFDKVVAVIAGEHSQIGQPYIEGASVEAKILKHDKDKKVIVYKMRRKKGYRVKQGHRQQYTRVLIENIEFPNKEETLNFVKELDEKLAKENEEKEAKLKEAKEKKLANKETKKQAKPKAEKPEEVEEVKAEVVETVVENVSEPEQASSENVENETETEEN